jgi:uncharacterized protein (DUF4415 family)
MKKFEFIKIKRINNFEKNPKKGGTPAIDKIIKVKIDNDVLSNFTSLNE